MRSNFHQELEDLDAQIVRMGGLVEESARMVTDAFAKADLVLAQKVRDGDQSIDDSFLYIETRALTTMAQQAPVARDLRLLVAILRVSTDLERAGDLAYNVAKLIQEADYRRPGLEGVRSLVTELGRAATELVGRAVDAWESKDLVLAEDIARQDDRLDDLHARLVQTLVGLKGEDNVGSAVRLAMIGRYFERIGDHAVNMAERLRYFVTGDEELLA
jgi:phosphate transport system protein